VHFPYRVAGAEGVSGILLQFVIKVENEMPIHLDIENKANPPRVSVANAFVDAEICH
jgi:hypothetical protein